MNEIPGELPYLMAIPKDENGDPDFHCTALAIIESLDQKPAGYQLTIRGRLDDGALGWFQARYEPGVWMTVRKECLGTKFGATLFMALQSLAPERVKAEP